MKRIIILNFGLHISGVTKALITYANKLVERGYSVTIKIENYDFTLLDELDPRISVNLFVPIKNRLLYGKIMSYFYKLPSWIQWKLIVGKRYDIEVSYNRGLGCKIISSSLNEKSKKIVFIHTDYMKSTNALAGFKNEEDAYNHYKLYDNVVCVSKQVREKFVERIGDTKNLVVKYNIIDENNICKNSSLHNFDKDNNLFYVCSIGRLSNEKNYFLLLQTAKLISKLDACIRFIVIGDGELKMELQSYIMKNDINNVQLLGAKSNPYPYLKNSDIYLSTSLYEGLSTTTIEAMILGKPVIVTNCAGMEEILGDCQYGIICDYDAEILAKSILELKNDTSLIKKYEKLSLERAKYFSSEKSFNNLEELLFFYK